MQETQNIILDFTHVYPEDIETRAEGLKRIDLSDIAGTDLYCTKEAEAEIRNRLKSVRPQGIHFLDNGNYHYMTKLLAEKIEFPFSLVLFDHHDDMQQPMIHELKSCGGWAGDMLRENSYLEQLILIGPDQENIEEIPPTVQKKLVCISIQELEAGKAEKQLAQIRVDLPAYISIDKDVLDCYSARTNWNQGGMSSETLQKLLSEVFTHQKVIGVDICGECSMEEPWRKRKGEQVENLEIDGILYHFLSAYFPYRMEEQEILMREYNRETKFWDSVYAESPSVDLRNEMLAVEPMFDVCLRYFAEHTRRVLDFGCGSGDILFQYHQYAPQNRGVGIDQSKEGIAAAKKTTKISDYHKLNFFEGGASMLDVFEAGEFDGIILSNVLDVMPEDVADNLLDRLDHITKKDGYWFIKLNPYYTQEELDALGYHELQPHVYDENGILRLRQETTEYWKKVLGRYGTLLDYVEFTYPWQEGMNRLLLIKHR